MAATYEFTGRFSALSTDPHARGALAPEIAYRKALSNFHYIARKDAVGNDGCIVVRTGGETRMIFDDYERSELCAEVKIALAERVAKHRPKRGIRVLDRAVGSLPQDASFPQQWEIAAGLVKEFGGNSEAAVIAAVHTDRPGNPHVHLWLIDGLEPEEMARERASRRKGKTRVRRRDYLRLGEIDGRKRARLRCAAVIDRIAVRDGLRRPETRSFKDRGLDKAAQRHEGPGVSAAIRKKRLVTGRALRNAQYNILRAFDELNPPPQRLRATASDDPDAMAEECMSTVTRFAMGGFIRTRSL